MSPTITPDTFTDSLPMVDSNKHIVDTLHLLADSPSARLRVMDNEICIGVIDAFSMIHGLATLISNRDDSSFIVVECPAEQYSASALAHAAEDADAHLVDLWSTPSDNGNIKVTLRVRHTDPSAVINSLERYGYEVSESFSHGDSRQLLIASERIQALQAILNV